MPRKISAAGDGQRSRPLLQEKFGRYRVLEQIGEGGMGTVYLAHDTQLNRKVAVKTPFFTGKDSEETLQRFYREAQAAATIEHPNICPVYDVGNIDGVPYITMSYIEGRPLSDFIDASHLQQPRQAASVIRRLALALAEAHRRGVVHRDLKPSNVMINQRREPVIMDFGLAQRSDAEDQITRVGMVIGTPAYMSPEQCRAQHDEVGPTSDIYSLGVMLYELLTGRPPFQGTGIGVIGQVLTEEPPPPSTLRPELDPALEAICLRAMAKVPDDRFASMEEFAEKLTEYLRSPEGPATDTQPIDGNQQHAEPDLTMEFFSTVAGEHQTRSFRNAQSRIRRRPAINHAMIWWSLGGLALCILIAVIAIASGSSEEFGYVQIDNGDPLAVVKIDGARLTEEQLANPLQLAVGSHDLEVLVSGVSIRSELITVAAEETLQVTVDAPEPESPVANVADLDEESGRILFSSEDKPQSSELSQGPQWPAALLEFGEVRGPDFASIAPVFKDDLDGPSGCFSTGPYKNYCTRGYRDGCFVIDHTGPASTVWSSPWQLPEDFAIGVEARSRKLGDAWHLEVFQQPNERKRGFSLRVEHDGTLRIEVRPNDNLGNTIIRQPQIKSESWNGLLVCVRDRHVEIYMNNSAVCQPVPMPHSLRGGHLLVGLTSKDQGSAEYRHVAVWPLDGTPTIKEQLASRPFRARLAEAKSELAQLQSQPLAAPEFKSELHRDDFSNPGSGLFQGTSPTGITRFAYQDGQYHISFQGKPGGTYHFYRDANWPAVPSAIAVKARVLPQQPTDHWGVFCFDQVQETGVRVTLSCDGQFFMDHIGRIPRKWNRGPIRHPAAQIGDRENEIALVIRAGWIEGYVNRRTICRPMYVGTRFLPTQSGLYVNGQNGTDARFDQVRIWSTEGMPPPETLPPAYRAATALANWDEKMQAWRKLVRARRYVQAVKELAGIPHDQLSEKQLSQWRAAQRITGQLIEFRDAVAKESAASAKRDDLTIRGVRAYGVKNYDSAGGQFELHVAGKSQRIALNGLSADDWEHLITKSTLESLELLRMVFHSCDADGDVSRVLRLKSQVVATEAGQRTFADLETCSIEPPATDERLVMNPARATFLKQSEAWSRKQLRPRPPRLLRAHRDTTSRVGCVALSPDGKYAAAGSTDNIARVYDLKSGQLVAAVDTTKDVFGLSFSLDSKQLIAVGNTTQVQVFDWQARTLAFQVDVPQRSFSVARVPTADHFFIGGDDGIIRELDLKQKKLLRSLNGHKASVNCLAFSPDGRRLGSASADGTVRIWNVKTAESIHHLRGHKGAVLAAAFSPNGLWLASVEARDRGVHVWNAETGKLIAALPGHADLVLSVAFTPDGSRLLTGSADRTLGVFDLSTGKPELFHVGAEGAVVGLSCSAESPLIATSDLAGGLRVWDSGRHRSRSGSRRAVSSPSRFVSLTKRAPLRAAADVIWVRDDKTVPWAAEYNLTPAVFEQRNEKRIADGYRPLAVQAYGGQAGAVQFSVVWVRDGRPFVYVPAGDRSYTHWMLRRIGRRWQPSSYDTFLLGKETYWTAVLTPTEFTWFEYHVKTSRMFFDEATSPPKLEKRRLAMAHIYGEPMSPRFDVFVTNESRPVQWWAHLSPKDVDQKLKSLPAGWRPELIQGHTAPDTRRYTMLAGPDSRHPDWKTSLALPVANLKKEAARMAREGYRPFALTVN